MAFVTEIEVNFKIYWEELNSQIAKTILNKNKNTRVITRPGFKLHHRPTEKRKLSCLCKVCENSIELL